MKPSRTFFSKVILVASTCITLLASAGEQIAPPGGIPCEADWINRSRFDSVATLGFLKYLERQAEQTGDAGLQLRVTIPRQSRGHSGCEPLEAAARGRLRGPSFLGPPMGGYSSP